MAETPAGPANPYVGPKPFDRQPLFGRDRETAELRYLLISERIVLLYAPSGAGKSSLVQAGLIPKVEDRFDVWGPTRVNQQPPLDVANRYTWSAVAGLAKSDAIASKITLEEYVKGRRQVESNPLIIFDQFEEILRVDPVDIGAKREFFDALGKVLRDPGIWALFVIREDYLAPLDAYARLIPSHLKNRYRIDRLSRAMAALAIDNPTRDSSRKYEPGIVDTLVANLAKVKVQQFDGSFRDEIGAYVEPLQLQVVCYDLWDRMKPDDLDIGSGDIGDVDSALQSYYQNAVARISGESVAAERAIREWVQDKLITKDGLRNQVRHEAENSGGLDNTLVSRLVDTYLVRVEPRDGITWYELAHDRLVEPLRQSNRLWFEQKLSRLQKRAAIWKADKPEGLLLAGAELEEAEQWAAANAVSPVEQELLRKSIARRNEIQTKEDAARRERELTAQLRRALKWVVPLAACALICLFISAYEWYKNAELKDQAEAATKRAETAEAKLRPYAEYAQAKGFSPKPTIPVNQASSTACTVYLQIRSDVPAQRDIAKTMKQQIEASGKCKVAGIEALSIGPAQRELRYFRSDKNTKTEADAIVRSISIEPKPEPRYVGLYEKRSVVPSHFEIWFEPGPVKAQVATSQTGVNVASKVDEKALQCFQDKDISFVARLYSRSARKNLDAAEALTISKAGLAIVAVYQDTNTDVAYFSAGRGAQDAAGALQLAASIPQPVGSAIYFAVDFNPSEAEVRGPVSDYFRSVGQAFAAAPTRYAVGVYGSGLTNRILHDSGLAAFTWLSAATAFAESKAFRPKANLVQMNSGQSCGIVSDTDVAQTSAYGAFTVRY